MSTENYSNYHFYENFFLEVSIDQTKSAATSPDQLPDMIRHNAMAAEIKLCLTGMTDAASKYNKYRELIFSPEEVWAPNTGNSYEAGFADARDEIVVKIDLISVSEPDQGAGTSFFGEARVTIDVFALRNWLKSRNEIACKSNATYGDNGCAHFVPETATHVSFGVPDPGTYLTSLKELYGSETNVPSYERVTPCVLNTDANNAAATWPENADDIQNYKDIIDDAAAVDITYLPAGTYMRIENAGGTGYFITGPQGDMDIVEILSGAHHGETAYINKSFLKLVTWDDSGLNKEQTALKEQLGKVVDRPLNDEPSSAAVNHKTFGGTHVVRRHMSPSSASSLSTILYSGPFKTTGQLGVLNKNICVRVVEQSLGKNLFFHKVLVTDLAAGGMHNKKGYVFSPDLRPIKSAMASGDWYYLPTVNTPVNKNSAGESPLLEKEWTTHSKYDGPWLKKETNAYWDDSYHIVVHGDHTNDRAASMTGLGQLVEYFDKRTSETTWPHFMALVKFGLKLVETDYYAKRGKKSLIAAPARFFDALPRNTDDFSFDYKPDLKSIKDAAASSAAVYSAAYSTDLDTLIKKALSEDYAKSSPTTFKQEIEKHANLGAGADIENENTVPIFAKAVQHVISGRIDYNPTVEKEKLAFTTGLYLSDLEKNITKTNKILKHYGKKIKASKSEITFPGFSGVLELKDEQKNLTSWLGALNNLLKINSVEFTKSAPKEENTPAKNDPTKSWIELGWNQEFKLLYVLFNGHPMKIGLKLLKLKEPLSLARTNAFVHRSPEIVKEFPSRASKRKPWVEWVKENVYPVAIIEPSNKSQIVSNKNKIKKAEAIERSKISTAKTAPQVATEDADINSVEISTQIQKEAVRDKIDTKDATFKELEEVLKAVNDIEEIYDLIFNKLPFESIAMEFLRCIGQDLDADGLIELLLRLGLKEIVKSYDGAMVPGNDLEHANNALDEVLELLLITKDCSLDILSSAFEIVVEKPLESSPLDDFSLPAWEAGTPAPFGPGADPTDPEDPVSVGVTHLVRHGATEKYSSPLNPKDKKVTFWKTLPWSPDPSATGYSPSGGSSYGRIEYGTAVKMIEFIGTPDLNSVEFYGDSATLPDFGNLLSSNYLKVSLTETIADLPLGTIGYLAEDVLEGIDAAVAAAIEKENQAVLFKRPARDGKNGLTNEIKALQSYMGAPAPAEQEGGPSGAPGTYTAGKLSGKSLIESMKTKSGFSTIDKTLTTEITNLDGIFGSNMEKLTKALGAAFIIEHELLPPNSDKQPLIDKGSAKKMADDGAVTSAAMEKIKLIYLSKISSSKEKGRLDDIKESLSFRSPSVILGTVLFAPPGFYEGDDSPCNKKFIPLVDQQTKYEAAFIKSGPDSDVALKEKLELEILFEEYRACMSAQGTNVYGNYISHLFGQDISPEEQKKKDGYKLVFAENSGEGDACSVLETALIATLGGEAIWPGHAAATDEQQTAYDAWLSCVHKTASEQTTKQKHAEKLSLKNNVIQMYVSSRHPVPITFASAYDLLVEKKVGLGGIPSLKLRDGAGANIADAILLPGRPCSDLKDTMVDLVIAYILEKYPEIELTVRYTLLAYKKSFELYAMVRNQMGRSNPFGLPKFPKMPVDGYDKSLTKNFEAALEKVLNEVLYVMLKDLVASLAEICKVINEDAAHQVNPDTVAADIMDNLGRNPDSGQLAKEILDKLGIDVFPPEKNNKQIAEDIIGVTVETHSRPTIYAFLLAVIDGLDKADICSIINRSASSTLIQSVKETVLATFPEHQEVISKESTIRAIFDMIAEIMPADFCDVIFVPPQNIGFTCLADLIEHNQKQRLRLAGMPEKDIEELITIRKTRNMKKLVDVAALLNDPEGTVKSAVPDICDTVKQELLSEPGFMGALNETVNSQLKMIKTTFNTDVTNFKPMILRTQEDLEAHASASAMASSPLGMFQSVGPSGDLGPPSNLNIEMLMADPEGMMLGMLEAAAQSEQPDAYAEQVDKYGEYLETVPRYSIYIPGSKRFMTYGQLREIGLLSLAADTNPNLDGAHYGAAINHLVSDDGEEGAAAYDNDLTIFANEDGAEEPTKFTAVTAKRAAGMGWAALGDSLREIFLNTSFNDIRKPDKMIKAANENELEKLMNYWLYIGDDELGLFTSHEDVLNERFSSDLPTSGIPALEMVEVQVPNKKPTYTSVATESTAIAQDRKVMGNFRNSLLNLDKDNLLTRPAVGSGESEGFKFTLNTIASAGQGVYGLRQYSLVEVDFPSSTKINNNFNVSVMTTPPKLTLSGPVLVKNSEGVLVPANPPPTTVLGGGDRTSYNSSKEMPLYASNFMDLLEKYIPHDSSQAGQTKSFMAFMYYTLEKHFPRLPAGATQADFVGFARDSFEDSELRTVYISMVNSIFESSLKAIGKSKYFLEDEISKLNLVPAMKDRSLCDMEEINPGLHLLGIDDIRTYISNAFVNDFNPCETQKQNGEPESLEQAISETCVLLFIRTTILETVLAGIHAYGTFDIGDLTDDIFVRTYMFDKCKESLRKLKQYKAFKTTALKVLDRKRKQNKEVIPLMNGADSLLYLFKRETKIMSPIYEAMLGSTFKDFGDILFENIIFPVPVNMHSELHSVDPWKRLSRSVNASSAAGLGSSNIKKYFGIRPSGTPVATGHDLGDIEISPGIKVPVSELGDMTFEDIFSKKPGFILERFVKLTTAPGYSTLVEKINDINELLKGTLSLPSDHPGIVYTPPAGPYISLSDFSLWLKSAAGVHDALKVIIGGSGSGKVEARQFLNNLLNNPWDLYYSEVAFGLRIKYLLPTGTLVPDDASSFPGLDISLESFKDKLGKFVDAYEDIVPSSPTPLDAGNATAEGKNNKFMKSSRVAFQSLEPIAHSSTAIYEIPLAEDVVTAKLGNQETTIFSFAALSTMAKNDGSMEKFYDIFFLPRLRGKLKNNNMVKSIFNFMLPTKKIVNACSVYTRELLETQYQTSTLFRSTKFAIASLHGAAANKNMAGWPVSNALSAGDINIDQEELSMEDKIGEIMLGFILKALLTAPPLIVKGVCEAADPNIMITKRIFDGVDMTVTTAMAFMVEAFEMARREYMVVATEANQVAKDIAAEAGNEVLADELPMPEYDNVREFMAFGMGINPPIDPTVGIPRAVAVGMAPAIALAMMPNMLPFGVGFPTPPFGPGLGAPMTPFAIPYLALGLIKEGGILEGLGLDGDLSRGKRSVCGDIISQRIDPALDLEEDDDPSVLDYLTDPGNQPVGPLDYNDIDII